MAAHESVWLCRARALDPEASLAPQEFFFFSREHVNKYRFKLLACSGKPPHPPTHTCLTRLLSLLLGMARGSSELGKEAESREGRGWEKELGTACCGRSQGPATGGKLGGCPEASAICESPREKHTLLGPLAIGLCVCSHCSVVSDSSGPHGL